MGTSWLQTLLCTPVRTGAKTRVDSTNSGSQESVQRILTCFTGVGWLRDDGSSHGVTGNHRVLRSADFSLYSVTTNDCQYGTSKPSLFIHNADCCCLARNTRPLTDTAYSVLKKHSTLIPFTNILLKVTQTHIQGHTSSQNKLRNTDSHSVSGLVFFPLPRLKRKARKHLLREINKHHTMLAVH